MPYIRLPTPSKLDLQNNDSRLPRTIISSRLIQDSDEELLFEAYVLLWVTSSAAFRTLRPQYIEFCLKFMTAVRAFKHTVYCRQHTFDHVFLLASNPFGRLQQALTKITL